MFKAAWKSLLGRKIRLLMSAFSIVLGIAFVSGSLIFTNLLGDSFDQILTGSIADVNVAAATSDTGTDAPDPAVAAVMDPDLVERISQVDGVAEATGSVTSSAIYALDKDGKVLAFGGAPGIGQNYFETPASGGKPGIGIVEGQAPDADDEVALDPATLARGGYAVGDELEVATPFDGVRTYRIVGTATFGGGGTAGASYLFFSTAEAQELFMDGQDAFNGVWVATEPTADVEQVTDAIAELLPAGVEAVSGPEQAEALEERLNVGLSFVNTFLLVFAAIALLVAALLILNTFSILVAQRSKELALFRALGAKRTQVRNSVLFEAAVIGLLGASVGIVAGWLLCWGIAISLRVIGLDLGSVVPQLTPQAIIASYVLGLGITMVAAWMPARKASATRPVEAMTAAAASGPEGIGVGVMIGFAALQLGAAGIVCGLWLDVPEPLAWVGIGCALVLVGLVLTAAVVGRPVVWLFGRLYRVVFGEVGRMAELNSLRQPRRTAATAATLMIGLSLVTTVAILADSTTTSLRAGLTESQRGDFLVTPVNFMPFDRAVAEEAETIDGVRAVWTYARTASVFGEERVPIVGTTPEGLADGTATEVLAGRLNPDDNSVLLSHEASRELDLPMGMTFRLPTVTGDTVELLVSGIYDEGTTGALFSHMIVNLETYAQLGDARVVDQIKVELADGADPDGVRKALDEATAELPTVVVTDNDEYADTLVSQFDQAFGIIYALLALAIVISVLGIVNTLGLSVFERTREIGLLRAVGMTRPQLRRLVTLESVIVAVLGSFLGVLLGLLFGVVLVEMLRDSGITHLGIPSGQLAVFLGLAVVFGIIAAFGPARRASGMNVLQAIAEE
ncbi:ABC transporter permease [Tessaracoccus sp. OS52]|uniref:ABC transporter permease n=1 Tax=Tessaracoccus sp. OS52 TaxID=2886691 RepID=UPI001D0F56D5|nr:FtsX-like permease family protein [Tessaracoccus sp. OS52]MCC2593810.1 ABC transporter permease [Tessaracoccus sp. OS52]